MTVTTTPEADAQIRTIHEWWREHRRASPYLFLDELASAFEILSRAPNIGRPYRRSSVPSTRRILLKETRYHVYYVPEEAEVKVLAVWHAARGVGPPIRLS